jgi:nucleotidyltransferase/DNA polymerase involved in DNA repair
MFLGYSTIGDVANIPFPILKDQFDDLSFLIHSSANGTLSDDVKASYPPQSCSARLIFDGATDSHLMVENAVEVLAERLGGQLDLQNLEGNIIVATLEYEDTTIVKLERTFSKPMRNADAILPSIHLLIEKSLEKPLSSMVILMTNLRKVNVAQSVFLDRLDRRTAPRLETTLRRVRSVFGDSSVKLGQEIKIPRRLQVLREWKHVTGWW